ncbi:hypothetical protein B0J13DRAFT_665906 [Dactylonectria estremocensis]|uniref:CFEM domain-containing protein n=1 Tax=Dactylonectria estremocensis TaxID=1079267 RepID=A0A9P9EUS7_9HYPO|nr:hypothetical protein B0J13DRAFT_665906 [Dactylonectria estremocensis]
MKLRAKLGVVLTIARFVEPQTLPSCAFSCVFNIDIFSSDSTVCDSSDYACQCTDEEYLGNSLCCLYEQCSNSAREDAEEYWVTFCGYLGHTVPSGILCSAVASSSADTLSTEPSRPNLSTVTAESTTVDGSISTVDTTTADVTTTDTTTTHGSIATAESTTVDGSTTTAESATAYNSGSETTANSVFATSSLPTSDRSNPGTTKSNDALILKLGLGLGIGFGVILLSIAFYLLYRQGKNSKQPEPRNNQELQILSSQAPPPQEHPHPYYPPTSHPTHGYQAPGPPPQVQSLQKQSDPYQYEHRGGAGNTGGNKNEHEVLGDMPPLRHELPSNSSQPHSEPPPDSRPHNELP